MDTANRTKNVKDLSDDILCAIIARNELRKQNLTPQSSPSQFVFFFHDYLDVKKTDDEKKAAQYERARKKRIMDYLNQGLLVEDRSGEKTLVITE
jgi:hypothetical protein